MAWLVIGFLLLLVAALSYGFFLNARALIRDMNRRVAAFEARLERDANAVIDHLLESK
jgi:hypothetical protein